MYQMYLHKAEIPATYWIVELRLAAGRVGDATTGVVRTCKNIKGIT